MGSSSVGRMTALRCFPKEKKVKKKVLFVTLIILLGVVSCASNAKAENKEFFYTLSKDELGFFMDIHKKLVQWEAGETEVSDKNFSKLYEMQIGKETLTSMLIENFLRNTTNKDIQQQTKNYIQKNKLNDKPFEKALLKKYEATPIEYEFNGKKVIRYSYNGKEFDENINLFDLSEVHPFNDEFGVLFFTGIDWTSLKLTSKKPDKTKKDKELTLLAGGNTHSIKIKFEEIDNAKINSVADLKALNLVKNIASNHKDNWTFMELDKVGILENCGVDNYCIGYGIGSDAYVSEIAAGDFIVCMYKKSTNKVYLMHTYMNLSKININYEIRNRLYNYILLLSLFCFCN